MDEFFITVKLSFKLSPFTRKLPRPIIKIIIGMVLDPTTMIFNRNFKFLRYYYELYNDGKIDRSLRFLYVESNVIHQNCVSILKLLICYCLKNDHFTLINNVDKTDLYLSFIHIGQISDEKFIELVDKYSINKSIILFDILSIKILENERVKTDYLFEKSSDRISNIMIDEIIENFNINKEQKEYLEKKKK